MPWMAPRAKLAERGDVEVALRELAERAVSSESVRARCREIRRPEIREPLGRRLDQMRWIGAKDATSASSPRAR
jgi:hypothetical protein